MVIILKPNPGATQVESLRKFLDQHGLQTHLSEGKNQTVIGLVGDTSRVDMEMLKALDIIEDVKRIQEPYKDANRKFPFSYNGGQYRFCRKGNLCSSLHPSAHGEASGFPTRIRKRQGIFQNYTRMRIANLLIARHRYKDNLHSD